jgi:transposase InsO family protein
MSWGTKDVTQRRIEFVIRAASGREQIRALCREFEISPQTGYKWLERFRQAGTLAGVQEQSRRPLRSPTRTSAEREALVVKHRQQRPDWGARKLKVLLAREGVSLPAVTIHRILLRQGLVRDAERHRPAVRRFEREQANQLWQMDYKGLPAVHSQQVMPLGILDDHSRYLVGLAALPNTGAKPLLEYLPTVFERCGVPEAMLVDHGTPWWNAQSPWGLTRVSLWLMKQNIELLHSGLRHPQTQGKVESSNRALQRQLNFRGWPSDTSAWPEWLRGFAEEWNQVRPHEALGGRTPAQCWHPSSRSFQPDPSPFPYPDSSTVRRVHEQGQIRFEGRSFTGPASLAGEDVALEHIAGGRYVVRYRATLIREIDLSSGTSRALPFEPYQDLFE